MKSGAWAEYDPVSILSPFINLTCVNLPSVESKGKICTFTDCALILCRFEFILLLADTKCNIQPACYMTKTLKVIYG